MQIAQTTLLWPLRLIAALSVVGPMALFAYAAWANYRAIDRRSYERIESALDVTQEYALKVLQTVERAVAEAGEVLKGRSDEEIRAEQPRISARLGQIGGTLDQVESIWAFDRFGRPLVTSTLVPVPANLNNSDRDYFRAHEGRSAGTFIGDVVQAKVGNLRFFVVSGRRPVGPDGAFNGVIGITVLPERVRDFYARLSGGLADFFGLIKDNGVFLARYPTVPDRPEQVDDRSGFARAIRSHPREGIYTSVAQIDGIERRIGYRRLAGFPVYVLAGVETEAVWRDLRDTMMSHLIFGIPATLAMFALSMAALRRTERFQSEVSRRESAEAALKQSQRLEAVGQLTGGVAHDFNNLLMVVKGNVERLRRFGTDERQQRSLDAIDSAADRGATLTRQLLSFSRQQTHTAVPLDLARELVRIEEMVRASLRGDIRLQVTAEEGLWPIKVDEAELELAILNIAVNARHAMPEGGSFSITASNATLHEDFAEGLRGDFVALRLSDTGTGIAESIVKRVFEPFFTTKEVGKGTGLGLSQVYGFARQSGGGARIDSRVGQGTSITLYLPRTQPQTAQAPSPVPEPASAARSRGTALLVEDNAAVADVTRSHLEDLGYEVVLAANGEAGLALLERGDDYALIFSDIVMPGAVNGLALARSARSGRPKTPIVLATGFSDVAQSATDDDFVLLKKPFGPPELRRALARAIRATRKRRAT